MSKDWQRGRQTFRVKLAPRGISSFHSVCVTLLEGGKLFMWYRQGQWHKWPPSRVECSLQHGRSIWRGVGNRGVRCRGPHVGPTVVMSRVTWWTLQSLWPRICSFRADRTHPQQQASALYSCRAGRQGCGRVSAGVRGQRRAAGKPCRVQTACVTSNTKFEKVKTCSLDIVTN